jgi:ribonuclease HII
MIAGVDEVGRGPLAGPVVVASVILNPDVDIPGITDSKKLTDKRRDVLFDLIIAAAIDYEIVRLDHHEIDRLNILQATMEGMRRSINQLSTMPTLALIDGNRVPHGVEVPMQAIIKGDAKESCIGAASILAKVTRDREMIEMDSKYPGYGFAKHKGYPTKQHLEAIELLGPCEIHRRSFSPIKQMRLF